MEIHKSLKTHAQNLALDSVNKLNLPDAMLIIPDGHGRWAKNLGLTVADGHKAGGKTLAEVLLHFVKVDVNVLGIWGFSEDNWKRSKEEIDKIMGVIESTIRESLNKLMDNNIKLIVLGKKDKVKYEYPKLYSTISDVVKKTSNNSGKTLALFIDYGEKYQLEEFAKARSENPNTPTYELLSKINEGLPLFDMVLRTSGEIRMSGFGPLASLAEFISVKKNLPDLSDADIIGALQEYSSRQRRFGGR